MSLSNVFSRDGTSLMRCRRAAYVQATSESVLPPGLRGSSETGAGGGVGAASAARDGAEERDDERPRLEPPRRDDARPPRLRPPRLRLRGRGSSNVSSDSERASMDMPSASGCEVQIVATRPSLCSSAAIACSVASLVTIRKWMCWGRIACSMPACRDITKSAALAPPRGETTVVQWGRWLSFF